MSTTALELPDTASAVLAAARERRAAADRAEADLLGLAVQWARKATGSAIPSGTS